MKTKRMPWIRVMGFLVTFTLVFTTISEVFSVKWEHGENSSRGFYTQPEGTIDVLFIGASDFLWGVSPLTIWEEAGITSYSRAAGAMQTPMIYHYFLESLAYQQPKLVVLDAYRLALYYPLTHLEWSYRRSFEPMRMSPVKLKAFFDITQGSSLDMSISLLFPFFRYHTRWNELTKEDFELTNGNDQYFKGQRVKFLARPTDVTEDFMTDTGERVRLEEESRHYYEKIIDYCKENNIEVMLVSMPRLATASYAEYLAVQDFAEQHEVLFIDYNFPDLWQAVGFNPQKDMIDKGHVNSCGAEKFSRHLAQFLQNNFMLPDRRQDPLAEQWNVDADELADMASNNCP